MKKVLLSLMFALAAIVAVHAQKDLKSTYSFTSDTTVNAATAYLSTYNPGAGASTTVQVVVTKISGTVAGTISLLGSLDNVNYKAITVEEAATASNTFTATDVASQTFIWRLVKNPYLYYRVSYAGTGTMSAKFTARLLTH